jgi:hypothetical protein
VHVYALEKWNAQGSNIIDWHVYRDSYLSWRSWYETYSGYGSGASKRRVIISETAALLGADKFDVNSPYKFAHQQNNCNTSVCPEFWPVATPTATFYPPPPTPTLTPVATINPDDNPSRCMAKCFMHPWMDWITAQPEVYAVLWFATWGGKVSLYWNGVCTTAACTTLTQYLGQVFKYCSQYWNNSNPNEQDIPGTVWCHEYP